MRGHVAQCGDAKAVGDAPFGTGRSGLSPHGKKPQLLTSQSLLSSDTAQRHEDAEDLDSESRAAREDHNRPTTHQSEGLASQM